MAIKNYTTKVPASRSLQEIQDSLVQHGALGIQLMYEKGTGKIESLNFLLPVEGKDVSFSLPVNWRKFQAVLKKDNVKRYDDADFVYRVAWRNIRDWVLAQMALYETQIIDIPQVFLPFAVGSDGRTIYEKVKDDKLLIG